MICRHHRHHPVDRPQAVASTRHGVGSRCQAGAARTHTPNIFAQPQQRTPQPAAAGVARRHGALSGTRTHTPHICALGERARSLNATRARRGCASAAAAAAASTLDVCDSIQCYSTVRPAALHKQPPASKQYTPHARAISSSRTHTYATHTNAQPQTSTSLSCFTSAPKIADEYLSNHPAQPSPRVSEP